jgi:uncharacterized protein (DUF1501 family)
MELTRREFLLRAASGCFGYALGASAFAAGLHRFGLINALAQGADDYKALVCVFLAGGNDGNNMIVPLSKADYADYVNVRGPSGLALSPDHLKLVQPDSVTAPFGFHENLAELVPLFEQQKLAVVCNVGPLVEPLTRDEYQNGGPRPYQLFSHADQIAQWQTAIADRIEQTGWGGRCAEQFGVHATGFPTVTALSGGIFGRGATTVPLSIASAPAPLDRLFVLNGFSDTRVDDARRSSMEFLRTIDTDATLVAAASGTTGQAVRIGRIMSSDVTVTTGFPDTPLGNQLKQVAKVIKFNRMIPELGLTRQIFFCQLGGFDTHQGQIGTHGSLLAQVSTALDAFYRETVELGLDRNITTFTLSDFGRTLQPAGFGGTVGSDHAWGNHHFVLGGAVHGRDFYGVRGPSGTVFPLLKLGGLSDADDRGRWIPTASVEQYAATLALWFGVAPGNLSVVFPNIGRFDTPTLGFIR